tara:strand:- start:4950 stop:5168 length:219 start_codon:yes stop_codon:yes gene_type:complete
MINPDVEATVANALKVMVYDPSIRAFLEANDPKALEQAEEALAFEEEQEYNEAQNRLNHSYAVNEYGLDADD